MTFLRLPNSKSFEAWKNNKKSNIKVKHDLRPIEFQRALSGYEHNLEKEDIVEMLLSNAIIPETFLKVSWKLS